ncbi:nitronate monooxygenase [Streptomyces sp. NPDC048425]|uniref:nitronate monooxygenase n=1 Tax=Streptomyces sp. NPDC048425 TaxID=3365548 RepID=UPI003712DD21
MVDAVSPLLVIAAGGIADGRGAGSSADARAQAAWMGTRFLAATEARTHDSCRRRVIDACAEEAHDTGCFDGGRPNTRTAPCVTAR